MRCHPTHYLPPALKHLDIAAGRTLLIHGAGGSVGSIAGKLDVPVWRAYPLAEAGQAQADLEARRNHGKVVLVP